MRDRVKADVTAELSCWLCHAAMHRVIEVQGVRKDGLVLLHAK